MPQTRTFVNDIVSSPVNLALVALICYFSYKLIARTFAKAPSASDPKHRKIEKMPRRDFTLAELREYDGLRRDDGRILVGVLGKVFDMSAGATFYGPGNVDSRIGKYLELVRYITIYFFVMETFY